MAGFESVLLIYVESVYIRVTSGEVESRVAYRDPQNIWNPQKNCGSFVDAIVGILNKTIVFSIT